MKAIKNYYNSLTGKINSLKAKDLLVISGIGGLMGLGLILGTTIFGVLGGGFGLALGYVFGKLIVLV